MVPGKLAGNARIIGGETFWPLTELDLLEQRPEASSVRAHSAAPSFTCSQTTTIFDNIVNQTFTVVNSLHLSQYNDQIGSSQGDSDKFNLYACIVEADVRRNYVTLGVHFRQASNKIPRDIEKRLQAMSVVGGGGVGGDVGIGVDVDGAADGRAGGTGTGGAPRSGLPKSYSSFDELINSNQNQPPTRYDFFKEQSVQCEYTIDVGPLHFRRR